MSTIQDAIKSVQDYGNQFTQALERHRGFLGDGAGTIYVADRDGYVYVRHRQAESADITGTMEPEEVIYSRSDIPPIEGYPVVFGRDIDTEDFQVLATDTTQLLGWIFDKYIKDHHEQHEFNEYDTVWIQKQAMLPLLVHPTSPVSTTVQVYAGWYQWDTDWHYFETTTSAELSSYVPTGAGQARFLLICIDGDTETLHYEAGDTFLEYMPPRDCEDRIPPPPEGKIPLAAIYLVVGETSFDWDIIYDVRLLFSGGGSMSTGSAPRDAAYVTLAYNDTLSAERLLSAGHGIIVTDNGPNDSVVISVNSAADYNWSGDHSFLSGIEFVGATGINSITIPDGLVQALHVVDTGGTEFLRYNTDDDYFLIDPGAAGIKVGIGTATVPHGGVGWGKFAIDGAANSMAGPHVLVTTAADDYPIFQQLNWAHDVIEMMFDAYYDGAYRSSDAGSNCNIRKRADQLDFLYDSGVAQGDAVVWNNGIVMDLTNGAITVGGTSLTVPAAWNLIVPDNVANAFGIDDVGGLEYLRINSANANPYFLIDPAAAGIRVGIWTNAPTAALHLICAAAHNAVLIDATTDDGNNALQFSQSGTGRAAYFYRDHAAPTRNLVYLIEDNTGSTQNILEIQNDGTGNSIVANTNFVVTTACEVGVGTPGPKSPLEIANITALNSGRVDMLRIAAGSDAIDDVAGVAFSTRGDVADRYIKSAIFHLQAANGNWGLGSLVFAVDSVADGADVSAADEKMRISSAGVVKITNLAGVGVRNVVAAADGTLSAP